MMCMFDRNKLRDEILKHLTVEGLTFEELRARLNANPYFLRLVVADMIREGLIVKIPDYKRKSFILKRLPSSLQECF